MRLKVIVLLFMCLILPKGNCQIKQKLDGKWVFSGTTHAGRPISGPATVPGGIYSDLVNHGTIKDILYEHGDVVNGWVGNRNWTYTFSFQVSDEILLKEAINLVFEGLDTFATIFINGEQVGTSTSMFVRYIFDIKEYLRADEDNTIQVNFTSPVATALLRSKQSPKDIPPNCPHYIYKGNCHVNQIRKMQASFGWDWGPAFPSMGIYRPVYLEAYSSAVIRDVIVRPVSTADDSWTVFIDVTYEKNNDTVNGTLKCTLYAENNQIITETKHVDIQRRPSGDVYTNTHMRVEFSDVYRWWPNGFEVYGGPNLYKLNIAFTSNNETSDKTIKIGFRDTAMLQNFLTKGRTLYFSVNGVDFFAKGANKVPSHILPEKADDPALVDKLLQTVKDSNMNMIRVWGGGIYESDYFYEKADELGILIWQDFMFACALYPTDKDFLADVRAEVNYQVKRLASHPSVIMWAGNNENEDALSNQWFHIGNFESYKQDYKVLYINTIRSALTALYYTANFITSTPSNGKTSDSDGYVASNPQDAFYGDVHFYHYWADSWNHRTFPIPRFCSEYGYQSLPAFESWTTALNTSGENLQDSLLYKRQHQLQGNSQNEQLVRNQLSLPGPTKPTYFKTYIYYSQIVQAQALRIQTEHYRSYTKRFEGTSGRGHTMGALYWQLNDVWVAPTWSGLDFTGRWKMLQYFAKDFFAPLIAYGKIDNKLLKVYAISDILPQKGPFLNASLMVAVHDWHKLKAKVTTNFPVTLRETFSTEVVSVPKDEILRLAQCNETSCFFRFQLQNMKGVAISPVNYLFLRKLMDSHLANADLKISSVAVLNATERTFEITLKTNAITLFVWLDSHDIMGRFSENGFLLVDTKKTVVFTAETTTTLENFKKALTVTHLRDAVHRD